MKQIITLIALFAATAIGFSAETNSVNNTTPALTVGDTNTPSVLNTNELSTKDLPKESYELTLGGGGFTSPKNGKSQFGLDTSLSTNPFKKYPNVWVGVDQDLSWQPSFAGETDIDADYAWDIYKEKLYIDTGWSVGTSYDTDPNFVLHNGPYVEAEYYIGDSSFIYGTISDDIPNKGDNQIQYKFGIGITF